MSISITFAASWKWFDNLRNY